MFLDGAPRTLAVYFLTNRSQFYKAIRAYKNPVENEQRNRIYRLILDRAGENTSTAVIKLILKSGMHLEYLFSHASQSNGATERLVQEIWRVARTAPLASKLPLNLWIEAIFHAKWIFIRIKNGLVELKDLYQLWFGTKMNLGMLLKFGQTRHAFEYNSDTAKGKKLLPRSLYSFFVGMGTTESMYRVYVPSKQTKPSLSVASLISLSSRKTTCFLL